MLGVETASLWIYAGISLFTCGEMEAVGNVFLTSPELYIFA